LNLPYFPIVYFGILKAGAVVVPLSVLLKPDEISYHLTDSEAKAYFCFLGTDELPMGQMGYNGFQNTNCEHFFLIMPKPEMPSSIEGVETMGQVMQGQSPMFECHQSGAEDTAVIVYTSGTTGQPKGAELTHSNLFINAQISIGLSDVNSEDTQLIVLPMFHIFAMTVLMNAGLLAGAHSILLPRFEAQACLQVMIKHKVSVFAGVPTMYWGLVNAEASSEQIQAVNQNLKIACSGGASLPLQVLEDFQKKFDVSILEGYGMSEGSPVVTFNQLDVGCKPGSIGTPVWGVEVKLINEEGQEVAVGEKGELLYRGHNVMKGYYNRAEATAESIKNGWMHSGDIAVKDEDGFYYIVDRTKDMIIRGGLNVYPREVEEVMIKHPAVSLVAIIGIPDEKFGEEIKAYVVLNEGEQIDEAALMAWTKGNIADYKYPRHIEFMDALPMNATGKILKKELRASL
jgi:long-chain acyl-CoA synthetase